jgi:hypothetical protein
VPPPTKKEKKKRFPRQPLERKGGRVQRKGKGRGRGKKDNSDASLRTKRSEEMRNVRSA